MAYAKVEGPPWTRVPTNADLAQVLVDAGKLPNDLAIGTVTNNAADLLSRIRTSLRNTLKSQPQIDVQDVLDAEELHSRSDDL